MNMSHVNDVNEIGQSPDKSAMAAASSSDTLSSVNFLKRLRRRSKTYSGEELAAKLTKKLFHQNTVTKCSEPGSLKTLTAVQQSRCYFISFSFLSSLSLLFKIKTMNSADLNQNYIFSIFQKNHL